MIALIVKFVLCIGVLVVFAYKYVMILFISARENRYILLKKEFDEFKKFFSRLRVPVF